ncbi:MAG: recombination protein O N-terminal domain-containing protein [bacterium]|nr:recombination protein O N-terminal domain-containing protein [bacterium]
MYQKYHTDALVLGSIESGEADRVLSLYTRDFGLVRARGTSLRAAKSKMRCALQNYSLANVALIRGKSGWRLAGAKSIATVNGENVKGVAAFARISGLVTRFVAGEEAHERLFEILLEAHTALAGKTCEAWAAIEIVCVARIMHTLGYISSEVLQTPLLSHTAYTDENLREATTLREELLRTINHAISETHL